MRDGRRQNHSNFLSSIQTKLSEHDHLQGVLVFHMNAAIISSNATLQRRQVPTLCSFKYALSRLAALKWLHGCAGFIHAGKATHQLSLPILLLT